MDELSARIAARKTLSNVPLRLDWLINLFRLDQLDLRVLLVCIAPEIDLRYERLFAYLQDDVQKRWPTVDLVLNLLCPTLAAKLEARQRFTMSAPLIEHRLIEVFDDPARPHASLLGKCLRVDPRIVGFLLGSDEIDPMLARCARWVRSDMAGTNRPVVEKALAGGKALALPAQAGPLFVHLQGPDETARQQWASANAGAAGASLLVVDGDRLLAEKDRTFEVLAQHAVRDAALRGRGSLLERSRRAPRRGSPAAAHRTAPGSDALRRLHLSCGNAGLGRHRWRPRDPSPARAAPLA